MIASLSGSSPYTWILFKKSVLLPESQSPQHRLLGSPLPEQQHRNYEMEMVPWLVIGWLADLQLRLMAMMTNS